MVCENCGKEHDGSYGSGRFCSKSCKCAFNAKKRHWKKTDIREWKCEVCGLTFSSRQKLKNHQHETNHIITSQKVLAENPICPFCGTEHKLQYAMTLHLRLCKKNPNRDIEFFKQISKTQKIVQNTKETKLKHSESAKNNNFWKYRAKNPIFYESKNNGTLKLDSAWELIVAKRLDELNLNWYRPRIRIPYIDNQGYEKGYFPDFYVEDYKCFVEVKSPYVTKRQNKNGKIDYLKSHYDFIFWIEDEELCNTFELRNMNYPYEVEKEVDDLIDEYKRKAEEKKIKKDRKISKSKNKPQSIKIKKLKKLKVKICKDKHPKNVIDSQLEKERWEIIQQSNIDFQKFGWVIEISKLFGISTNRGGKYIRKHFPEFYKTCYVRKPCKLPTV